MDDTQSTQHSDYLRPLKARWWLIVVIAAVVAAGTYRYYASKPVVYQASASLYLQASSGPEATQALTDPSFLANHAILLRTEGVAAAAARELHYRGYPGNLLGLISVIPETGTDVLEITATAPRPGDAGRIANAFAQAYISTQESTSKRSEAKTVSQLETRLAQVPRDSLHADQRTQLADQVASLQLLQSTPTAPAILVQAAGLGSPITASATSRAVYGLILGLLIGCALAYAIDGMNRRLKRVADLEALYGAPVLAKIPSAPRRICDGDPRDGLQSPLAESFRGLRSLLQLSSSSEGVSDLKTIMVVSAVPGEGKSTVARQLALAYLEAGNRVAVVDCDLRRPDVSRSFQVPAQPGLPEVLIGAVATAEALKVVDVKTEELATVARARQAAHVDSMMLVGGSSDVSTIIPAELAERKSPRDPQLSVLPAQSPSWNPAAIFAAGRLDGVLRELRADNDVVIIDTPPLAAVSDAASLLPLVDAVLVVSRLKVTPTHAASDLRRLLESVPHAASVGVVANDVNDGPATYAYARSYGS